MDNELTEDLPATELLSETLVLPHEPRETGAVEIPSDLFKAAVQELGVPPEVFAAALLAFRQAGDRTMEAAGRSQWVYEDWKAAGKAYATVLGEQTGEEMTPRQLRRFLDEARAEWCEMHGIERAAVSGQPMRAPS